MPAYSYGTNRNKKTHSIATCARPPVYNGCLRIIPFPHWHLQYRHIYFIINEWENCLLWLRFEFGTYGYVGGNRNDYTTWKRDILILN